MARKSCIRWAATGALLSASEATLVNETDYTHVTYDIDTLTDYDELATRFSWNYAWSEQVELFTRFGVRRYEPDEGSAVASSNSYTPTVGMNFQISERLRGSVYAGAQSSLRHG